LEEKGRTALKEKKRLAYISPSLCELRATKKFDAPFAREIQKWQRAKREKEVGIYISPSLRISRDQKKLFFIAQEKCDPYRLALIEIRLAKAVSYFAIRVSGLKARSYFF